MACMAVMVASLPLFGMSSMSMRIRGRLSRWWKFGAAHSTSFGEPNTSSYRYWIAYLRRLAEPALSGSRGPASSRSQVIERIAPVLEHTSRDNDCFHSMYPSHDAPAAVLARFLVDGYTCWGSLRALSPDSKLWRPDPPPRDSRLYLAWS